MITFKRKKNNLKKKNTSVEYVKEFASLIGDVLKSIRQSYVYQSGIPKSNNTCLIYLSALSRSSSLLNAINEHALPGSYTSFDLLLTQRCGGQMGNLSGLICRTMGSSGKHDSVNYMESGKSESWEHLLQLDERCMLE